MRWNIVWCTIGLAISANAASGQPRNADRMNRMIPLIQQKLPVLKLTKHVRLLFIIVL